MTMELFWVHVALSLTLFLVLNWIGRHSPSSGYITLSAFLRRDEAPAFNLIFRVVGPVVFIVLIASLLYSVGLEPFVRNIWLVVLYYYVGRLIFVFAFGRLRLLNWKRESFLWIASIGLSWFVSDNIIQVREYLLPEIKDLKNQFWLLVILFLYAAFNNIRLTQDGTKKRKADYLTNEFKRCKEKFGEIVRAAATDELSESLIFTVLLFERFNRPAVVRFVEHVVFPCSKSLGPMQVTTGQRLTDRDSVRVGAQHVIDLYKSAIDTGTTKAAEKGKRFDPLANRSHRQFVVYKVAAGYNKDDDYLAGIQEMHAHVVEYLYPSLALAPYPHWSESLV